MIATGNGARKGRTGAAQGVPARQRGSHVVVAGVSDQVELRDRARREAFKTVMPAEGEPDAESFPQQSFCRGWDTRCCVARRPHPKWS